LLDAQQTPKHQNTKTLKHPIVDVAAGHKFTSATSRCDDWVAKRIDNPLHVLFDFIYYRSDNGKEYLKDAEIMHSICRNVIKERKEKHAEVAGAETISIAFVTLPRSALVCSLFAIARSQNLRRAPLPCAGLARTISHAVFM
jgi:hypothetical protein